jgi:hypothetical protein
MTGSSMKFCREDGFAAAILSHHWTGCPVCGNAANKAIQPAETRLLRKIIANNVPGILHCA